MRYIECCSQYQAVKRYIYKDEETVFLKECAICKRSILYFENKFSFAKKAKELFRKLQKLGLLKRVKEMSDGSLNNWIYGKQQKPYYFDTNKRVVAKCS